MASKLERTAESQDTAPALRRELNLRDLTLFAIVCIISTRWIPAAAHAGPGAVVLWLAAAIFFVIPIAIAVATLSAKYPGAGGIYVSTRGDFGPWHGFLCFWMYWTGIAFWFPSAAMFYVSMAAYTLGPSYEYLADNRLYIMCASMIAIWIALGTNLIGLRIGKWTENIGGIATWFLAAMLVVTAAIVYIRRGSATPLQLMPEWNWRTLSFWSAIAYGMSGFELAGFMGAEIRNPPRDLPRAAWFASISTALFYSATTLALLVLLRPSDVNEMNGFGQAGAAAGRIIGTNLLAPVIALLVIATAIGQFGGMGTSVSRMPYAAGVDRLLPDAFSRVHPRWATPYVSILALGGIATFLLVFIQFGDSTKSAYQALVSLMIIGGFVPYLYMFASAWKAGKRISAVLGASVTLFALVCSLIPTEDVTNVWLYEFKLVMGAAAIVASARWVYSRAEHRQVPTS